MEDIEPFQVMYTDFTELRFADGRRKAYLIPILGHATKMVYGWAVGETTDTPLALKAWQRAQDTLQRLGIRYAGMILHQDQDPVFTSYAWVTQLLRKDGVRPSYALRGAKDNPEMESFISRFKTEGNSLFLDATTLAELDTVVEGRMGYHNQERRHSALGYVAPRVYVDQVLNDRGKGS